MISEVIVLALGTVGFISLSGFFAGSETGFVSVNRIKLNHMMENGNERARLILRMLKRPSGILGTTLVGTNICVVSATVLTNQLLLHFMPPYAATLLSTVGLTLLMLMVSEIIPKTLFQSRANELTLRYAPLLRFAYFLFYPVSQLVSSISHFLLYLTGKHRERGEQGYSRDDIDLLASLGAQEGIISPTAQAFIHSVFSFGQATAREIMTPLVDVVSVEQGRSINAAVKAVEASGFSRIPVYKEQAYDMQGYVSAFDLLYSRKRDTLTRYLRPAVFVPETKRIDRLLVEMRQNAVPMVFVVDEWGGTAGIVTHEDIAEYIVGQIRDRGEKASNDIDEVGPGNYLVDGLTDVDLLCEKLNLQVEKQGFETTAGFVEYLMQRIPAAGEHTEYGAYRIIVEEADRTSLKRVRFLKRSSRQPRQSGKRKGTST